MLNNKRKSRSSSVEKEQEALSIASESNKRERRVKEKINYKKITNKALEKVEEKMTMKLNKYKIN